MKYKVEVGGFVTVFRKRNMIVYAKTDEEAKEKAIERFMEIQQSDGSSMCSDATAETVKSIQ